MKNEPQLVAVAPPIDHETVDMLERLLADVKAGVVQNVVLAWTRDREPGGYHAKGDRAGMVFAIERVKMRLLGAFVRSESQ